MAESIVGYIAYAVAIAATATSTALSVQASNRAAKQSELNAEAASEAAAAERRRQELELSENQRRAAIEQKRFRAQQFSQLASTGALTGTGTALAIEADTWANQQRQLADQQYLADISRRNLQYQGTSALQMGRQEAAGYRAQATGQALSGLASIAGTSYSAWSTRPQQVQTAA